MIWLPEVEQLVNICALLTKACTFVPIERNASHPRMPTAWYSFSSGDATGYAVSGEVLVPVQPTPHGHGEAGKRTSIGFFEVEQPMYLQCRAGRSVGKRRTEHRHSGMVRTADWHGKGSIEHPASVTLVPSTGTGTCASLGFPQEATCTHETMENDENTINSNARQPVNMCAAART